MKLETIDMQPTIAAGRFDLRPPRASDAGLLAHYVGDERVARNTSSIPHPLPPGTIEAFLARVAAPDRIETVWICLLYTSPSPRDLSTSRMPSSA